MAFKSLSFVASLITLISLVTAGDNKWLSPEYKDIFKNPLPIPPVKKPITFVTETLSYIYTTNQLCRSYTNATTGVPIDYYEIEIKPFTQSVYSGKKNASLIGYDGISPGPTFMM